MSVNDTDERRVTEREREVSWAMLRALFDGPPPEESLAAVRARWGLDDDSPDPAE